MDKYRQLLAEYSKHIKDEILMIESGARIATYHREKKSREEELQK
jgi:hypothetical protein